jgi:small GTP-binding protein
VGKTVGYDRITSHDDPEYRFNKKHQSTQNFNIKKKTLSFLDPDGNTISTHITFWDTTGQENAEGSSLRNEYIYKSDAIIMMYDVNNRRSKENITKWLTDVKETCGDIPVAVCGNKADKLGDMTMGLLSKSQFRLSTLNQFMSKSNCATFLMSVKTDKSYSEDAGWFSSDMVEYDSAFKPVLEWIVSTKQRKPLELEL